MEIIEAHRLTFAALQLFLEKTFGEIRHEIEALVPLAGGKFLGALLLLNHLDVVFLGKISERVRVGHVLMIHHKAHRGASLMAAETVIYSLGRHDMERWGLLVVEGAAAPPIGPSLSQSHEVGHHLLDTGGVKDFLYRLLRDHCSSTVSSSCTITLDNLKVDINSATP